MMRTVDLRSDTITRPGEGMRKAMSEAEVGDDVFGEDPTINALQEKVAAMCGKEDALFVASGTMGNQIALKVHTQPGDEVILDANCHILNYEAGAPGLLAGVQLRSLEGKRGILRADQIAAVLRGENIHFAPQRLVCLENTHNRGGGSIYPLEEMEQIYRLASSHDLRVHLDGARLWNASVATGIPVETYCRYVDSASLCFSKGLGAPVGSILVGTREFIREARRIRKALGGGMRQAGILAAAALYALENHLPLLAEDHRRAKELAEFLAEQPLVTINPAEVETNIIIFDWNHPRVPPTELQKMLEKEGVRCLAIGPTRLRMVLHLEIGDEDVKYVKKVFANVIRNLA